MNRSVWLKPQKVFPFAVAAGLGIFLAVASHVLNWTDTETLVVGCALAAVLTLVGAPLILLEQLQDRSSEEQVERLREKVAQLQEEAVRLEARAQAARKLHGDWAVVLGSEGKLAGRSRTRTKAIERVASELWEPDLSKNQKSIGALGRNVTPAAAMLVRQYGKYLAAVHEAYSENARVGIDTAGEISGESHGAEVGDSRSERTLAWFAHEGWVPNKGVNLIDVMTGSEERWEHDGSNLDQIGLESYVGARIGLFDSGAIANSGDEPKSSRAAVEAEMA